MNAPQDNTPFEFPKPVGLDAATLRAKLLETTYLYFISRLRGGITLEELAEYEKTRKTP